MAPRFVAWLGWGFVLLLIAIQTGGTAEATAEPEDSLSIEITSPLGRTGIPGTIRIVARIRPPEDANVMLARFLVDGAMVGEVTDGPPYPLCQ